MDEESIEQDQKTVMQERLDRIYLETEKSVHEQLAAYEQYLAAIEKKVSFARQKTTQLVNEKLSCLKSDLTYAPLVERVQKEEFKREECTTHLIDQIDALFHARKWLDIAPAIPIHGVSEHMANVRFNYSHLEAALYYYENRELLSNDEQLKGQKCDPFLVNIVSVFSPEEFYVHRRCDADGMHQMIQALNPNNFEESQNIKTGTIYAVYVNYQKSWLRGRCERQFGCFQMGDSPDELLYDFFLLDEGVCENVPSSHVRDLPIEIQKAQPLALRCRLKNKVSDSLRDHSNETLRHFKQLVQHSPLNMLVYSQTIDCLEVDLSQIPKSAGEKYVVSIADSLNFHQNAIISKLARPQHDHYHPKLTNVDRDSKLYGVVTHVDSPRRIYINFNHADNVKFPALLQEMQAEFCNPTAEINLAVRNVAVGKHVFSCQFIHLLISFDSLLGPLLIFDFDSIHQVVFMLPSYRINGIA